MNVWLPLADRTVQSVSILGQLRRFEESHLKVLRLLGFVSNLNQCGISRALGVSPSETNYLYLCAAEGEPYHDTELQNIGNKLLYACLFTLMGAAANAEVNTS